MINGNSRDPNAGVSPVAAVVREFESRLRAVFGPDLLDLRLFGSYARSEASEDSDVDVFVLLRRAGYPERRAVLDIAGDLFLTTSLLVSATIFDADTHAAHLRQGRPLVTAIEREGLRF